MKRYIYLILTAALFLAIFPEYSRAQSTPLMLRGYVLGADTNITIPLANIQKKPSGDRYISNRYGGFSIMVEENDTLIFSVIGYHNLILPVKKYVSSHWTDPIKVKLKPIVYKLKTAEVNYNQKRRDSLARQAAKILKTAPVFNDYEHLHSWVSSATGGPGNIITALSESSNKKLQEYNKVLRLIELYHEQERIDEKYNNNLIMRATGIEEGKIPAFKKYCQLPSSFILNSNEYDLVLAIRSCYADYLRRGY